MKYQYQYQTIPAGATDAQVATTLNQWGADGYDITIIGTNKVFAKKQLRQPADVDHNAVIDQLTQAALTAMQDPTFPAPSYTPDTLTDGVKNQVRAIVTAVVGAWPNVA